MRFVAGFLIGLVLGAAVVLLTTPRSGADMQSQAKSWVDDILNEGRKAAELRRAELEARVADLQAGLGA
ncbi:MAG: YtxH domain-containing protein [Anaerolineae bacterium]|nr:YtxH domain-containing protein [Anaerolineae bacterium]MCB0179050.1 YtxH domain-containing protein [Anaerolineae bacterium]MCB0224984.1 YtxH domain-containing protein [Anaerolineae bacterium]MCB9108854.1 YtxH domain-containing protein [Anaerolineales bacterium]